jgi:hypothetical protein
MTKPFHAGRAAENGLLAASLAGQGFTTASNILEAGRGFFSAAGGGYDPTKITDRLGDPWTFVDPGVSIKPYPSGSLTHPAMTAFLDLVQAHDLRAAEVEEVRVGTNRHMPNAPEGRPRDRGARRLRQEQPRESDERAGTPAEVHGLPGGGRHRRRRRPAAGTFALRCHAAALAGSGGP